LPSVMVRSFLLIPYTGILCLFNLNDVYKISYLLSKVNLGRYCIEKRVRLG